MITSTQPLKSLAALVCCLTTFACYSQVTNTIAKAPEQETLKITFQNNVGNQPLVLGKDYTNSFGETYSVQKFRYYISQIELTDNSDMTVQLFKNDYFLVAESDSSTRTITLPLSLKHISTLAFVIGVDSTRNVSGVQEGSLDPGNGMFWTWNTGYIMAKLQGKSTSAHSAGHNFTFDVGGFKTGENTTRRVEFNLQPNRRNNKIIHNIVINTDLNKWFNGVNAIKIAEHPGCHEPGPLAVQIADNYEKMFSLGQVSR